MALQDRARSFLGSLGFIGEESSAWEEEQEEFEDEPEEEDEKRPAWYKRLLGLLGFGRDEEDEEEEEEGLPAEPITPVRSPRAAQMQRESRIPPVRDNVIRDERMTGRAQQTARAPHKERVVDVRRIDECKKLIECLLQGETVLVCLENMDPKDCGRIVDLLSGAAFALQGRMIKAAHLCYLLAPQSVEVIDEKERQGRPL